MIRRPAVRGQDGGRAVAFRTWNEINLLLPLPTRLPETTIDAVERTNERTNACVRRNSYLVENKTAIKRFQDGI